MCNDDSGPSIHKTIIRTSKIPLSLIDRDTVYFFSAFRIFAYDIPTRKYRLITKLSGVVWWKRVLSRWFWTRRLLRLYPRCACFNDGVLYFALCGNCYALDIHLGAIVRSAPFVPTMKGPLNLVKYGRGVLFGDYLSNPKRQEVCVRYFDVDGMRCVAMLSGPRHIHGIIAKHRVNGLFYVLTGDEDNESAIWELKMGQACLRGEISRHSPLGQGYRACTGVSNGSAFIFATDSPYQQNYLRLLDFDGDGANLGLNYPLPGSVIYGCSDDRWLLFSTAVEGNLRKDEAGANVSIPIDGVHGGIRSRSSFLYLVDSSDQKVFIIDEKKKDTMNHYFGIGTFLFAESSLKNTFVYYTLTLKRAKNRTIILSIEG